MKNYVKLLFVSIVLMAVAVSCSKSSGPVPTPGMVDLGLSVKWASFNLGASNPEDCGGYYQWAGTEDVSDTGIDVSWSTCPYHNGEDCDTGWTKYVSFCFPEYWGGPGDPDNKLSLEPGDNAVLVKLGGKWRMPTPAEWEELRDECTWTWTVRNGVKGYLVSGKKSGYTDKSIFLPAAGYRDGGTLHSVGVDGYYWSMSVSSSLPNYAGGADFSEYGIWSEDHGYARYCGFPIRPVAK